MVNDNTPLEPAVVANPRGVVLLSIPSDSVAGMMLAFPVDVIDSGLDWAVFYVSLAGAVGTVGAVVVALIQIARSRDDAKRSREDADQARADAKAERDLRLRAVESQRQTELEASAMVADAHREIEADRRRLAVVEDTERRAARQAQWVDAKSGWLDGAISGDLHATIVCVVSNQSDDQITDVVLWFDRGAGLTDEYATGGYRDIQRLGTTSAIGRKNGHRATKLAYVWGHTANDPLHFIVEFTDAHRDRWRLRTFDRQLRLLTRRDIAPAGPADVIDLPSE